MAEFLTMEEAEDKFGKKGTARAGLTLGIIGTAQTWAATGGLLQPGFVLEHSSADNISISGSSLSVENTGTYYIDVKVTGTPATASATVIPTINIKRDSCSQRS